jgi:hypothetical protein
MPADEHGHFGFRKNGSGSKSGRNQMSISRRGFLKTTAIAGASVAIEGLPAWAGPMGTQAENPRMQKAQENSPQA